MNTFSTPNFSPALWDFSLACPAAQVCSPRSSLKTKSDVSKKYDYSWAMEAVNLSQIK